MFNKVILIGRLGRDPEVKTSQQTGNAYCNFSLATNSGYGDKKETDWHFIKSFGKTAESVGKFLKKGSLALVEGRIHYNQYEKDGVKKEVTEIIADNVRFMSSKDDKEVQANEGAPKDSYQKPKSDDTFEGVFFDGGAINEEIPF